MEIGRLAADLHKLGDRSVIEPRKYVAGLSAVYEIEVRILENNPAGLERAEIERVVKNRYNKLFRQQQDSEAKGFIGIGRHHHGRSRRQAETAQTIRGYLVQLRKQGSPR